MFRLKNVLKQILTICTILVTFISVAVAVVDQQNFKTHHRLSLNIPKNQFVLKKLNNKIILETLNIKVFDEVVNSLATMQLDQSVFKSFEADRNGYPNNPALITFYLKADNTELFSFYRDSEKKFIMDFWNAKDKVSSMSSAVSKKALPVLKESKPTVAKVTKKPIKKINDVAKATTEQRVSIKKAQVKEQLGPYRDFRYGNSFIWDYEALAPTLEMDINLSRKTPDFLYPIKDRVYSKDDKEAHLQLSVNLYRKEKWGYLAKSLDLYEKKYGIDSNQNFNDYLKACSLLKKNIKEQNKSVTSSAVNLLEAIFERSDDYAMKKAIARYLIQYYRDAKAPVKTLQLAKTLFVDAKKGFDKDMVTWASKVILNSLAELKQVDKMKSFIDDISAQQLISDQLAKSYIYYTYLIRGQLDKILVSWDENNKNFSDPIDSALIYNVAEAMYRTSRFEDSIKLYDKFIKYYSHMTNASQARLRVATIYDLLDKDPKIVLQLYKDAIDKTSDVKSRLEAKIRYVGLRIARKRDVTKEDAEFLVFLEMSQEEKGKMDLNLKKSLWLTRLRSFVSMGNYNEALAYLSTIPLNSLKPVERVVFKADGAEIVYALVRKQHQQGEFASAVKVWEVYKDKYENTVTKNPYIFYTVADSYVQLGLYNSFERTLGNLKKISEKAIRTFPIWIERSNTDVEVLGGELEIKKSIAAGEWQQARDQIVSLATKTNFKNKGYYLALIEFNQKNYAQAVKQIENLLTKGNFKANNEAEIVNKLVTIYAEALYKTNQYEKFNKVASALLEDMKSAKALSASIERISYMLIESLAAESQKNTKKILKLCQSFTEEFPKSDYRFRVSFLNGVSLMETGDKTRGQSILEELVSDKSTPDIIKELARSELSSRELLEQI